MIDKITIGIVEIKGKILLVKRATKEGNLEWVFPGGKIEENESEEESVEREIYEETNIRCKATKKLGQRTHPDTGKIISYWICDYLSGDEAIKNPKEIKKIKWLIPNEIFKIIKTNIYRPLIEYLKKL